MRATALSLRIRCAATILDKAAHMCTVMPVHVLANRGGIWVTLPLPPEFLASKAFPGTSLNSDRRCAADARKGLSLKDGLLDSLHALEHRAQQLSHSLAEQMHALSYALAHPGVLADSPHNLTAPDSVSAGLELLKQRLKLLNTQPQKPQNPTLRLPDAQKADLLQQMTEAVQQFVLTRGHDSTPGHDGVSTAPTAPMLLDFWLIDIINRSVVWPVPRWPLYVFMAGALACLFLSALCHLVACCSQHVSISIWRLDYAGASPVPTHRHFLACPALFPHLSHCAGGEARHLSIPTQVSMALLLMLCSMFSIAASNWTAAAVADLAEVCRHRVQHRELVLSERLLRLPVHPFSSQRVPHHSHHAWLCNTPRLHA